MRESLVTALLGSSLRPHPSASTLLLSFPTVIQPFPPPLPPPSVMATPHVIASSSTHTSQPATTTGVVGNHFRVGKKIGEGSFGVVFEGAYRSLLPPQITLLIVHPQVQIFSPTIPSLSSLYVTLVLSVNPL